MKTYVILDSDGNCKTICEAFLEALSRQLIPAATVAAGTVGIFKFIDSIAINRRRRAGPV